MVPPIDADNSTALIRNAPLTARGDRIGDRLGDWKMEAQDFRRS